MFDTAPLGLAAEIAMLGDVASGNAPASAFVWQVKDPWLVLPDRFARSDAFEMASSACARAGWPVTTRKTGGGITPQGPGVLDVAIAFQVEKAQSRTVRDSYAAICDPLVEAFAALGVNSTAEPVEGSFCDGDYNLAVGGRKIVGTAQRWRRNTCLCHALILTDIDLGSAVAAVQRLSTGLAHGDTFDVAVHARLADLVPDAADLNTRIVNAIWAALKARDYRRWTVAQ